MIGFEQLNNMQQKAVMQTEATRFGAGRCW